jgi:serine carboxypeptidase-like clade I
MMMDLATIIIKFLSVTFFFSCIDNVVSAPLADRIHQLPLYGKPPTPQYSGYLNGTDGCDTKTNGEFCFIHYWLAMSKKGIDAPVVLWLNGGPGSSSLLGFVQELGPLLMNATGGLMDNPWSWTNVANVFVIESPVGVGYSYCANQLEGKVCKNTDKYTASTARAAIVSFFDKFPELAKNDFFITGESYAGVYIPTLAREIVDKAPHVNLVGLAVGDPCTDNDAQLDSMDSLWYGHKYGLVDDAIFDILWNKCHIRSPTILAKGRFSKDDKTKKRVEQLEMMTPECQLAYRKFLLSSSRGLSQSWDEIYVDDYSLFAPVTNVEDDAMTAYLNRSDVREALHVTESPIIDWPDPSVGFDYTKQYDACNDQPEPHAPSMIKFYNYLAPKLQRIWVYNGDTDPCVSYEGTRTAIKRVGFPEIDGGSYRPWFYNHTAAPLDVLQQKAVMFGPDLLAVSTGAQFGGEVVNYENNLSFLTVHGSGHMVPQFRPQAALHMISKFVKMEHLAPLLPSNDTLTSICTMGFNGMMKNWTEKAKKCPYVCDCCEEEDVAKVE